MIQKYIQFQKAGYQVGGPDCWEHEPVELLRQHETALPVITIEIVETLGSLVKKSTLENMSLIMDGMLKIGHVFAKVSKMFSTA